MAGNDTLHIRTYAQDDAAVLSDIYAFQVREGVASFEQSPPDAEAMHLRMTDILGRGCPVLVANLGGRAVGYAYAAPYRPRESYRWTVESSVYVDESQHGNGIGRVLMSALIDDVKKAGYQQMIAVVTSEHDENPSMAFHRALGFRESGRLQRVGFKHGRWLDTVMMQLTLNNDDTPQEPLEIPPRS